MHNSAESRAKKKPSVQLAHIQRNGVKVSQWLTCCTAKRAAPVPSCSWRSEDDGARGRIRSCVRAGGLETPFLAKVNAGESTRVDDCASNNKPWFLLGLPTTHSSASSKYHFPFSCLQSKRQ